MDSSDSKEKIVLDHIHCSIYCSSVLTSSSSFHFYFVAFFGSLMSSSSPQTVSKISCACICLSAASKSNGRNRWINNNCFKVNKRSQAILHTHTPIGAEKKNSKIARAEEREKKKAYSTGNTQTISIVSMLDNVRARSLLRLIF